MRITNIAFLRAKTGREAALGDLLIELAELSRGEPGCVEYALHQSPDAPSLWFVYENWRSEQDLESHFRTIHMRRFAQASAALMDGEMKLGLFEPVTAARELRAA